MNKFTSSAIVLAMALSLGACTRITDGEDDVDFIYPRVVDEAVWMEEVVDWMNFEGDDGTTLITDVIERAFVEAIESGSATIDLP